MLSLIVMLSIAVVTPSDGGAPKQPPPASAGLGPEVRRDAAMRRLAAEPLDVVRTYEILVAKPKPDRMRAYGELSSSMKASMWSHQLLTALAEHPEFTEERRAVLYDALALFTPEFFEITYPNPDWSTRVDQPVRKIEQRARAAFGLVLARQLLAQLGPDRTTAVTAPAPSPHRPQATLQTAPARSAVQVEARPPADHILSTHAEVAAVLTDSAWPANLSVSEGEATRTYASLLEQNASERRRSYRAMPSATKAALWIHQLRSALQSHPEYTTAQRAVIHEALSLLTVDFFGIEFSDHRWADRVDTPLRDLMAQAQTEFGAKMALELFGDLGPRRASSAGSAGTEKGSPPRLGRAAPLDDVSGIPTCTCNIWYDFCGSDSSCVQGGCYFLNVGCGWFWQYYCTGLCVAHDPPWG